MSQIVDAAVLERAAVILRERSRKPDGVMVTALCRVLARQAARIRAEAGSTFRDTPDGGDQG